MISAAISSGGEYADLANPHPSVLPSAPSPFSLPAALWLHQASTKSSLRLKLHLFRKPKLLYCCFGSFGGFFPSRFRLVSVDICSHETFNFTVLQLAAPLFKEIKVVSVEKTIPTAPLKHSQWLQKKTLNLLLVQIYYYGSLASNWTSRIQFFFPLNPPRKRMKRCIFRSPLDQTSLGAIRRQRRPDGVQWDWFDSPGDLFRHSNDLFTLSHAQQIIGGVN